MGGGGGGGGGGQRKHLLQAEKEEDSASMMTVEIYRWLCVRFALQDVTGSGGNNNSQTQVNK